MNSYLAEYAKLKETIDKAQKRMKEIEAALKADVVKTGSQISAYGYTAKMKPGRKSINHEAAAIEAKVDAEIIKKFTTLPSPRVAWAKVTKEANVSKEILEKFTTQAPESFEIKAK